MPLNRRDQREHLGTIGTRAYHPKAMALVVLNVSAPVSYEDNFRTGVLTTNDADPNVTPPPDGRIYEGSSVGTVGLLPRWTGTVQNVTLEVFVRTGNVDLPWALVGSTTFDGTDDTEAQISTGFRDFFVRVKTGVDAGHPFEAIIGIA